MIRRRSKAGRDTSTPDAKPSTLQGPPFRRMAGLPPDDAPTMVDPPGTRPDSRVGEEAGTLPMAFRQTPYGQKLPSLEEVKGRIVALAMGWTCMYGIEFAMLQPVASAAQVKLKEHGIQLPRNERLARQRLEENTALIADVLKDVERLGISPDGILLPSALQVRQSYRECYEEGRILNLGPHGPQEEELLNQIVAEVRRIIMSSRCLIAGMEEQQLYAVIGKALDKASKGRLVRDPEPKPAPREREIRPEKPPRSKRKAKSPGSFLDVHVTGRAIGIGFIAAVAAVMALGVVRNLPPRDRSGPSPTLVSPSERSVGSTQTNHENYENAIFANGGKIEDAVIIRVGNVLRENSESLHLSQIFDIYDWVKTEIHYLNVLEGYKPRPAGLTLAAGQGDCKNMAALFASMTASIGARTGIALIDGHVYNLVSSRTTKAPMPLPMRISGMANVKAKAPITPSMEKVASITSR